MTAVLRMPSLGISADAMIEYIRLAETTNSEYLLRFCKAIVVSSEEEWLRLPTEKKPVELERHYEKLGFPGCIGCLDCASWEWKNCPVALQRQHKGKEKKSCFRMQVVCDNFLRIWNVMLGTPGAKNDVNIMHQSTLFNAIRTRRKAVELVFGVLFSHFHILCKPSRQW